eukprot:CAMPEP_0184984150 /NCGR_PEP_ID=MMETSP1098-20130426/13181_1 /TAXON_ID=89044 /ORGANISM="Spumella elongata, Strain CCAP 955/1" /LENGTH=173 /DNA_ID=CAMNT_0027508083 /DNA_START=116 /DNA_END=634 /DNA_ORIENTATION=-
MKLQVWIGIFALFTISNFELNLFQSVGDKNGIVLNPSGSFLFCSADDSVFMGFGSKQRHEDRNSGGLDVDASSLQGTIDSEIEEALKEIPSLPSPKVHDPLEPVHQLEVNGDSIAMTELGPIIVNADGTLRRIENWSKLTKQEQANTMRVVTRRNKKRLEALKELQKEEETEQ